MDTGPAALSTTAVERETILVINGSKHSQQFLPPVWLTETYSYAAEAAEFGAMWAETSVPQFLHADEAAEHLGNALHRERRDSLDKFDAYCTAVAILFHTAALNTDVKNVRTLCK